jgi:hypothetical protein
VSSGEAKRAKLLALLAGLVETINAERADVIVGIERFGAGRNNLLPLSAMKLPSLMQCVPMSKPIQHSSPR